jgi:hypothetical protein
MSASPGALIPARRVLRARTSRQRQRRLIPNLLQRKRRSNLFNPRYRRQLVQYEFLQRPNVRHGDSDQVVAVRVIREHSITRRVRRCGARIPARRSFVGSFRLMLMNTLNLRPSALVGQRVAGLALRLLATMRSALARAGGRVQVVETRSPCLGIFVSNHLRQTPWQRLAGGHVGFHRRGAGLLARACQAAHLLRSHWERSR